MKLVAVVFDWAGTLVDHGSRAPVAAFRGAFAEHGVEVSEAATRRPMGQEKRAHIRAMLADPEVRDPWVASHGREPEEGDVCVLYDRVEPLTFEAIPRHAAPIPGVPALLEALAARGVRVGSTTGYTRPMLDVLLPVAAAVGVSPEVAIAASEVPAGRPAPWLCWEAARRLGVYPANAIVKVGDTIVDMEAGRNAGFWTVGVSLSGNLVGRDAEGLAALGHAERSQARAKATRQCRAAGAHLVIDSTAELLAAMGAIERRMAAGERP